MSNFLYMYVYKHTHIYNMYTHGTYVSFIKYSHNMLITSKSYTCSYFANYYPFLFSMRLFLTTC